VITASQASLYARLRGDGATPDEAIIILLTTAEVSRIWDLSAKAYLHEPRGAHGKWSKEGLAHAAASGRPVAHVSAPRPAAAPAATAKDLEAMHQKSVAAAAAMLAAEKKRHDKDVQNVASTVAKVRAAHDQYVAAQAKEGTEKRRKVLAWHAGALVAGSVLAAVEAKTGVPDLAVIASALGPTLGSEIIDFWKKLS
jgi:hypothetical protein